jgi:cytochrome c biogenesis protein CcmG, thiol:disulfide interchange protein DsbE
LPSTRSSEPADRPRPRRPRGWLLILAGVLTVGLVAGVLVAVLGGGSDSSGTMRPGSVSGAGAEVGSLAPDFQLPALDGHGNERLADYRGRPVIVNFWASWCNPCRKEFPLLKEALRDHRAQHLAVIGVTYQDIPSDSRTFVKQKAATWPQGVDDGGAVASAYGVRAIPQSFFIRADGTIAARVFGVTSESALAGPLAQLLGSAPG